MPITLSCTSCGSKVNAPETAAGRRAPCPKCRTILTVPVPEADAESRKEAFAAFVAENIPQTSPLPTSGTPQNNPLSSSIWESDGKPKGPCVSAEEQSEASRQVNPQTYSLYDSETSPEGPIRPTRAAAELKKSPAPQRTATTDNGPSDSAAHETEGRWHAFALVGATAIVCGLVSFALYALGSRNVSPSARPDAQSLSDSSSDKRLAEAKRLEQQLADERADLVKHNTELTIREKALTDERTGAEQVAEVDKARAQDAAVLAKAERLQALRKRIGELIKADDENRAIVATYDSKTLTTFAQVGVTSDDKQRESVADYWKGRELLISNWNRKANDWIAELEAAVPTMLPTILPDELQKAFRTEAKELLANARKATEAPFVLSETLLAECKQIAQQAVAAKAEERKKRSEAAKKKAQDYFNSLPLSGLARARYSTAEGMLHYIHSSYVTGKLSKDTVNGLIRISSGYKPEDRKLVWQEAKFLAQLSGDAIIEYSNQSNKNATVSEAWAAFEEIAKQYLDDALKPK